MINLKPLLITSLGRKRKAGLISTCRRMDPEQTQEYQIIQPQRVDPPVEDIDSSDIDNASSRVSHESDPDDPRTSTEQNLQCFDDKFAPFVIIDKLVYENNPRPRNQANGLPRLLFAHRLVSHKLLNPAFYHPNIAVRGIETRELLAKLRAFEAVNRTARYECTHLLESRLH